MVQSVHLLSEAKGTSDKIYYQTLIRRRYEELYYGNQLMDYGSY